MDERIATVGAVAVGGIAGAEARYGLAVLWPPSAGEWAWATLVTNVSGCLLMGVLMVLVTERRRVHPLVRPLLGVGVLGGYTTFSTAVVDVLGMARAGAVVLAAGYLVATPVLAIGATWAGVRATRAMMAA